MNKIRENLSQKDSENASWLGLDLSSKTVANTLETRVLDSSAAVIQSIKSSTEIAIAILRIDDVLWARQAPTIPDEIQQSLENG